jgi:hypothetical protein
MLQVFKHGFLASRSDEFEIRSGPRLRMSYIVNPVRSLFNPQEFELNCLSCGYGATHAEHSAAGHICPKLFALNSLRRSYPVATNPREFSNGDFLLLFDGRTERER